MEQKRQAIGHVDRTDRLRSCRKQGTVGAGKCACSERPNAALRPEPGVCPTFFAYNLTSQISF